MTAKAACIAMEKGVKRAMPKASCILVPLADGGEGTMHTLVDAAGGQIFQREVTGPLGTPVMGEYAILNDGKTGVVELASASGLHLVPHAERNPLVTTTYGTGQLIEAALDHGVEKLVIGLGGSATNDGGVGIAQALGIRFLDQHGSEIGYGGSALAGLVTIDTTNLITLNKNITVEIACDVVNPLTGPNGASSVFGPQKGATAEMIAILDHNLKHLAKQIEVFTGMNVDHIPGAGAAGGSGAGLTAFLNACLVSGIDTIIRHTNLEKKIMDADYVLTGEGSLDQQTLSGKTLSGVMAIARKHDKPVIAFAGKISDTAALYQAGFTSIFPILSQLSSLEEALAMGAEHLESGVYAVARLIKAGRF